MSKKLLTKAIDLSIDIIDQADLILTNQNGGTAAAVEKNYINIQGNFKDGKDLLDYTTTEKFNDKDFSNAFSCLYRRGVNLLRPEIIAATEFIPITPDGNLNTDTGLSLSLGENKKISVTQVMRLIELHHNVHMSNQVIVQQVIKNLANQQLSSIDSRLVTPVNRLNVESVYEYLMSDSYQNSAPWNFIYSRSFQGSAETNLLNIGVDAMINDTDSFSFVKVLNQNTDQEQNESEGNEASITLAQYKEIVLQNESLIKGVPALRRVFELVLLEKVVEGIVEYFLSISGLSDVFKHLIDLRSNQGGTNMWDFRNTTVLKEHSESIKKLHKLIAGKSSMGNSGALYIDESNEATDQAGVAAVAIAGGSTLDISDAKDALFGNQSNPYHRYKRQKYFIKNADVTRGLNTDVKNVDHEITNLQILIQLFINLAGSSLLTSDLKLSDKSAGPTLSGESFINPAYNSDYLNIVTSLKRLDNSSQMGGLFNSFIQRGAQQKGASRPDGIEDGYTHTGTHPNTAYNAGERLAPRSFKVDPLTEDACTYFSQFNSDTYTDAKASNQSMTNYGNLFALTLYDLAAGINTSKLGPQGFRISNLNFGGEKNDYTVQDYFRNLLGEDIANRIAYDENGAKRGMIQSEGYIASVSEKLPETENMGRLTGMFVRSSLEENAATEAYNYIPSETTRGPGIPPDFRTGIESMLQIASTQGDATFNEASTYADEFANFATDLALDINAIFGLDSQFNTPNDSIINQGVVNLAKPMDMFKTITAAIANEIEKMADMTSYTSDYGDMDDEFAKELFHYYCYVMTGDTRVTNSMHNMYFQATYNNLQTNYAFTRPQASEKQRTGARLGVYSQHLSPPCWASHWVLRYVLESSLGLGHAELVRGRREVYHEDQMFGVEQTISPRRMLPYPNTEEADFINWNALLYAYKGPGSLGFYDYSGPEWPFWGWGTNNGGTHGVFSTQCYVGDTLSTGGSGFGLSAGSEGTSTGPGDLLDTYPEDGGFTSAFGNVGRNATKKAALAAAGDDDIESIESGDYDDISVAVQFGAQKTSEWYYKTLLGYLKPYHPQNTAEAYDDKYAGASSIESVFGPAGYEGNYNKTDADTICHAKIPLAIYTSFKNYFESVAPSYFSKVLEDTTTKPLSYKYKIKRSGNSNVTLINDLNYESGGPLNFNEFHRNFVAFTLFARILGKADGVMYEINSDINHKTTHKLTYEKNSILGIVAALREQNYVHAMTVADTTEMHPLKKVSYVKCLSALANVQNIIESVGRSIYDKLVPIMQHAAGMQRASQHVKNFFNQDVTDGKSQKMNFGLAYMGRNFTPENFSSIISDSFVLNSNIAWSQIHKNYSEFLAPSSDKLFFTNSENISPTQFKLMTIALSEQGFGLLGNETSGRKTVFHIGLPSNFIQSARLDAFKKSGDEGFVKSNVVCFHIFKYDDDPGNCLFYPKSFIFDASKYTVENNINITPRQLSEFNDNFTYSDIRDNFSLYNFDGNSVTEFIGLGGVFDPGTLEYLSSQKNSAIRKQALNNHIFDHYFKMYYKLATNLDFKEYVFPINDANKFLVANDISVDDLYNNAFVDDMFLNYPSANVDEKLRAHFNRLLKTGKSSQYFSAENRLKSIIAPKSFDRVFSVLVNESDFLAHKPGDFTRFDDLYSECPTFRLDSGIQIKGVNLNTLSDLQVDVNGIESIETSAGTARSLLHHLLEADGSLIPLTNNYFCVASIVKV